MVLLGRFNQAKDPGTALSAARSIGKLPMEAERRHDHAITPPSAAIYTLWRCASRIDYSTKYCHDSPTIYERPLQAAILATINKVMSQRTVLLERISNSMRMELVPIPEGFLSLADIDRPIAELNQEFQTLFAKSRNAD